ncbi:MerR family transcriptional regulator [Kordiimonas sp. SCSIO 12603]|uniref:MerR family transcriptional regulator n=1 Tax=Kordiimonas sp. SCSIO 12603 TaxID=2829596 RepID=UPI00210611FA|nr:MerR family transcriptional regulator [Kordiimonas sp. SCSIO 12603]UTW57541.1 MerR family transcriptional regulator [Kordiimonas sp. SCSIO 12603]
MAEDSATGRDKSGKGREAFRTISEVAEYLDLPQHVLRFWESKFAQIKPLKRGGNRRYYRPEDVELITAIKQLLHVDGYTIRGVQKLFKSQGVKATIALAKGENEPLTVDAILEKQEQVSPASMKQPVEQQAKPISSSDDKRISSVLSQLKALRAKLD